MSRLSSAPPAPDLQASARRREEQMALLREECGTWPPKQPQPMTSDPAKVAAHWSAMQARIAARRGVRS